MHGLYVKLQLVRTIYSSFCSLIIIRVYHGLKYLYHDLHQHFPGEMIRNVSVCTSEIT
jgi:hypothetical protein